MTTDGHKHEPSTFWYPCFLCEKATYERQIAESSCPPSDDHRAEAEPAEIA